MIRSSICGLVLLAAPASPARAQLPALGVGPVAPLHLQDAHLRLLPGTSHLGSVVDRMLLGGVSGQPSLGALARFEPLRLSVHGHGWTQQRFFLDDVELADPASPGEPLLALPPTLLAELRVVSLWTDAPGVHYALPSHAPPGASLQARGGGAVGGGTWVPDGWMDREPALRLGASPARRSLREARELTAVAVAPLPGGHLRLATELVQHDRTFPTLLDEAGRELPDPARSVVGLGSARFTLAGVPVQLNLAWQGVDLAHDGAAGRLPRELTLARRSDAVLVHGGTDLALPGGWRLRLRGGVGWRQETSTATASGPWSFDLERAWTWLARPSLPETSRRSRYDLVAALWGGGGTSLSLRASHADLQIDPALPGGAITTTWRGAAPPQSSAAYLTALSPRRELEAHDAARLSVDHERHIGRVELRLHAAVDVAAVSVPEGVRWGGADVAAGAALTLPGERTCLYAASRCSWGARCRAFWIRATCRARCTAGATTATWRSRPARPASSCGAPGATHICAAPGLRRPTGHELVVAWAAPTFGLAGAPLHVLIRGVGRLTVDPWTVRLAGPAAASYQPRLVTDPRGGAPLVVHERRAGSEGREIYVLANAATPDLYLGAEVWLANAEPGWWLFALGVTGYLSQSTGAFGLFDRNDPGVLDEASADPNALINARGRAGHDRAFGGNLLVGVQPDGWLDGLSCGLVVRYRDGEPTARLLALDLPQGPTVVMATPRGEPKPRLTFQLTVDLRVAYALRLRGLEVGVSLEVENLLGSGTELAEEPFSGAGYRRALEMIPGRAMYVGLALAWPR